MSNKSDPPGTESSEKTDISELYGKRKFSNVPPFLKLMRPKKKIAIVFGYVGEKYCGLQWNRRPDHPTIEESLMEALFETEMISEINYRNPKVQQLLGWERASRTDKGVHALLNVVSVSLMLPYSQDYIDQARKNLSEGDLLEENDQSEANEALGGNSKDASDQKLDVYSFSEAKKLLNQALPRDIHVYEMVPVTRSFNAYLCCGGRRYEYYLPTFALMRHEEFSKEYFPESLAPSRPTLDEVGFLPKKRSSAAAASADNRSEIGEPSEKRAKTESQEASSNMEVDKSQEYTDKVLPPTSESTVHRFHDGLFEAMLLFRSIPDKAMQSISTYRIATDQLNCVRKLFCSYEGTHSFHNFTPGGSGTDPSCNRYVRQVTVSDPFVVFPSQDPYILESIEEWSPSRFFSPDDYVSEYYETLFQKICDEMGHSDQQATADGREAQRLRTIMREKIQKTYTKGLEVVRVEFDGQSFMLNQIRKMVGAVIGAASSGLDENFIKNTLLNKDLRRGIPMAPANGLFLSFLDFQRYNYRLERIQQEGQNGKGKDGLYVDAVNAEELESHRKRILSVILRNEMVEDIMGRWMRSLRQVLRLAWDVNVP